MANQTAAATETDEMPSSIQTGEPGPSGNLVDDILNGAYEDKDIGEPINTEELLGGDDGAAFGNVDLLDD